LDAAGFIPGEGSAAAGIQYGVATASAVKSAVHGDTFGRNLGAGGELVSIIAAVNSLGPATWAKAIPFVGIVVNGVATAHDLSSAYKEYHTNPFDRLIKSAALVVTLFAVLFYFVFENIGGSAKGRVASICAAMIVTTVWMRWGLRKRLWFWVTIAIMAFLHLPLVLLPPWTNNSYPGIVLLPGALLDLAIVYGSIKLAEKVMKRS
jgi:hypothetical protein